MDVNSAHGLIRKFLDYRVENNRIILYENTDYSQLVSFYENTLEALEYISKMSFLVIRNNDNFLRTIFNPTVQVDPLTGNYSYVVDWLPEYGDVIYIDGFILPLLPELKDSGHLNYYTGYFGYIQVGETNTKRIVRFNEDDAGRSTPFNPCTMGESNYTIYWEEANLAFTEIDEDDYRNLIEQSHRNVYERIGVTDYYLDYFQLLHVSTGAINLGQPADTVNELSSAFSIVKKDCNKYELVSNEGFDEVTSITVKNEITGDIIYPNLSDRHFVPLSISMPFSFSVPGDGIYSVSITKTLIPEIGQTSTVLEYSYIFYEHCSLQKCYQSLLKSLYCNDIYCCDDCSREVLYEKNRRIAEINKMVGLYTQLMLAIHSHHALYFNENPNQDETYSVYLNGIKELWKTIEIVYNRCGDCDPSSEQENGCNC